MLCVVIGIMIGVLCTYLIFRTRKYSSFCHNKGAKSDSNMLSEQLGNNIESDLQNAWKEVDRMKVLVEGLQKELDQAQHQLKEQEIAILTNRDIDGKNFIQEENEKNKISIKNLKNKIEELEEKLDDTKDERDSFSKKIERQKEELASLQNIKTEYQKLHEEFVAVQKKLKIQTQDHEQKKQALNFVSRILQADVSEKDQGRSSAQLNDIDKFAEFLKEKCFPLMEENKKNTEQEKTSLTRWVANKKKTWINGKIAIAFVGEFSAGKTSIVNRILMQGNSNAITLPVSSKATTAIPTYISGAGETGQSVFKFVAPDESQKRIDEQTFKQVKKEILDEVRGVSNLIKYFVMSYDNPNLENLSILDTPGFNSNDREDAMRTLEVINECDALFWVFDINNGNINKTSLKVIKENLQKPLYIVINKVDSKSSSEVQAVEKLIVDTLQKEGVSHKEIIHFSHKSDINVLMNIIKTVQPEKFTGNYIDGITKKLSDLNDEKRKELVTVHEQLRSYRSKIEKNEKAIDNIKSTIENCCSSIKTIPTLKKRWLSTSKVFEMKEEEGNRLFYLVDLIAGSDSNNLIEKLTSKIELLTENVKKYNSRQEKASKLESDRLRLKLNEEQFNQLTKNLEQ